MPRNPAPCAAFWENGCKTEARSPQGPGSFHETVNKKQQDSRAYLRRNSSSVHTTGRPYTAFKKAEPTLTCRYKRSKMHSPAGEIIHKARRAAAHAQSGGQRRQRQPGPQSLTAQPPQHKEQQHQRNGNGGPDVGQRDDGVANGQRRVTCGVLHRMACLMGSHTHSGHRAAIIHILRQAHHPLGGVVVVGEVAGHRFHPHIGKAVGVQNAAGRLSAGQPAAQDHGAVPGKGAFDAHLRPQSHQHGRNDQQNVVPVRQKEKGHDSKLLCKSAFCAFFFL